MNVPMHQLAPWQVYALIASVPAILLLGLSGVIWDVLKEWLETNRVRDLMPEMRSEVVEPLRPWQRKAVERILALPPGTRLVISSTRGKTR